MKIIANITIKGQNYTNIEVDTFGDGSIFITTKEAAKMVRQYLKKNYPKLKTWVRIETYSMGSSINVSLTKLDYSKYRNSLYSELKERFTTNRFDGMTDSWNHKKLESDLGTDITFSHNGISVYEKY